MDCRDCGHDWEELIADDVSRRQHDDNLLETQPNNQLRFVKDGYAHDIKWETLLQRFSGHRPPWFRVETN